MSEGQLMDLAEQLGWGINERGNYAFSNGEGHAVLFAKVSENLWIQAAYSPMNYPAWDVSTFAGTEEDLVNHITTNLGGWRIDKAQCDLNENDGILVDGDDIVADVVEHVIHMAEKYDFDPTGTMDGLGDVIMDSASVLRYKLTDAMADKCYEEIMECHGK